MTNRMRNTSTDRQNRVPGDGGEKSPTVIALLRIAILQTTRDRSLNQRYVLAVLLSHYRIAIEKKAYVSLEKV